MFILGYDARNKPIYPRSRMVYIRTGWKTSTIAVEDCIAVKKTPSGMITIKKPSGTTAHVYSDKCVVISYL